MKLFQRLKAAFNYGFYSEYRFRRVVRHRLMRYYTTEAPRATNKQKMVVAMFDGRKRHGGLADRLRGICTTYCFCREKGLDFRLHFTSPFRLEEFLIPNQYDWRIDEELLCYHALDAHPVYIASQNYDEERDNRFQRRMAEKFFAEDYKQLHAYTNMRFEEAQFGVTFHELFRPAEWLQKLVDEQLTILGGKRAYIAVSTRFLESLGDFSEHRDRAPKALTAEEQEALLKACCSQLEKIHAAHPEERILVTSDSARFLSHVARYDFVRTLPGKIGHMDVVEGEKEVHTKTFLDFLVLSEAKRHYYLIGPHMYRGNFSRRAAQIGEAPFHEICF